MHKALLIISIYMLSFTQVPTIVKYKKMLTSDDEQEWVLENTDIHLSGNNCTNGMVVSFSLPSKKVIWKDCIKGKWVSNVYSWNIIKSSSSQFNLVISNKGSYEIDFIKKQGQHNEFLRLRILGKGKDQEDIDLYFARN